MSTELQLRVGLCGIGLDAYWSQFAGLKERLESHLARLAERLKRPGVAVMNLGLIDTPQHSQLAGRQCRINDVDVLLTPTVPIPPPKIADLKANPDQLRPQELTMLRNTRPFNVWGIPTISVPCGFTKDGLPIGLQMAAAPWRGIVLLQAAQAYEQATEWHKRRPESVGIT